MAVTVDQTVNARLPQDRNSQVIQVLSPVQSTSVNGTSTAASARLTVPVTSEIILVSNTEDIWAKFGDVTVSIAVGGEANSFLFLAGERAVQTPIGITHLAFLRRVNDGVVCLTNMN